MKMDSTHLRGYSFFLLSDQMALYFEMYLKVDWVRLECESSNVNLMAKIT